MAKGKEKKVGEEKWRRGNILEGLGQDRASCPVDPNNERDSKKDGVKREGHNRHLQILILLCNGQEALRQLQNPSDWSRFSP
ncbi:hypothetical protein Csa_012972 [Cucumis sativus]|uniref:Uncharacterized protein n=1 Tax=Cucumis sativus TaxID=3659 RepID=A0A0A0L0Q2_CUCSA|nr:hypothetical protein Csa_012972 [Cucumis sativus]